MGGDENETRGAAGGTDIESMREREKVQGVARRKSMWELWE